MSINLNGKKVFISAKVTDEQGNKDTADLGFANNLFDILENRGLQPFFSEHENIQKRMKNQQYEEYINEHLQNSDAFVFLSTDESHLNSKYIFSEVDSYLNSIDKEIKTKDSFFRFNTYGKIKSNNFDKSIHPLIERLNKINNIKLDSIKLDESLNKLADIIVESFNEPILEASNVKTSKLSNELTPSEKEYSNEVIGLPHKLSRFRKSYTTDMSKPMSPEKFRQENSDEELETIIRFGEDILSYKEKIGHDNLHKFNQDFSIVEQVITQVQNALSIKEIKIKLIGFRLNSIVLKGILKSYSELKPKEMKKKFKKQEIISIKNQVNGLNGKNTDFDIKYNNLDFTFDLFRSFPFKMYEVTVLISKSN